MNSRAGRETSASQGVCTVLGPKAVEDTADQIVMGLGWRAEKEEAHKEPWLSSRNITQEISFISQDPCCLNEPISPPEGQVSHVRDRL